MQAYDPSRRSSRKARRVVRKGSELFGVEGDDRELMDSVPLTSREEDDDTRILSELPPHWFIHNS